MSSEHEHTSLSSVGVIEAVLNQATCIIQRWTSCRCLLPRRAEPWWMTSAAESRWRLTSRTGNRSSLPTPRAPACCCSTGPSDDRVTVPLVSHMHHASLYPEQPPWLPWQQGEGHCGERMIFEIQDLRVEVEQTIYDQSRPIYKVGLELIRKKAVAYWILSRVA